MDVGVRLCNLIVRPDPLRDGCNNSADGGEVEEGPPPEGSEVRQAGREPPTAPKTRLRRTS